MITVQYYIENYSGFGSKEEIVIFDRGKKDDGTPMFRWYRKTNIPDDFHGVVWDDPDENILATIAYYTGCNVTKEYSVSPPDELEWWMGVYIYTPYLRVIHCDPVAYGTDCDDEDPYDCQNDRSQQLADFMSPYSEEII